MTVSAPHIFRPRRATAPDRPADRAQERAFRSIMRTIGLLDRVMQPHFARFGISASQWAALRVLHRAELHGRGDLRLTDLGERLLVRPPSVSGVIDRLERGGLVVRVAAPLDHRAKQIRLTPRGRRLIEQTLVVHGEEIDRVLAGLSAPDQDELHRLLERLSGHLERLLQRTNCAADMGGDSEINP